MRSRRRARERRRSRGERARVARVPEPEDERVIGDRTPATINRNAGRGLKLTHAAPARALAALSEAVAEIGRRSRRRRCVESVRRRAARIGVVDRSRSAAPRARARARARRRARRRRRCRRRRARVRDRRRRRRSGVRRRRDRLGRRLDRQTRHLCIGRRNRLLDGLSRVGAYRGRIRRRVLDASTPIVQRLNARRATRATRAREPCSKRRDLCGRATRAAHPPILFVRVLERDLIGCQRAHATARRARRRRRRSASPAARSSGET